LCGNKNGDDKQSELAYVHHKEANYVINNLLKGTCRKISMDQGIVKLVLMERTAKEAQQKKIHKTMSKGREWSRSMEMEAGHTNGNLEAINIRYCSDHTGTAQTI